MHMGQIMMVESWHTQLRASPMLSGTGETQGYTDATYESAEVVLMALDALARSMRRDIDREAPTNELTTELTTREIELIDVMIDVQKAHAERCDSISNRTMAEKQKGWDLERILLLEKLKAARKAPKEQA